MTFHLTPPRPATDAVHSIVHRDETAFCGWPFYCGLWRVANGDLVVGFKRISLSYDAAETVSHERLTYRRGELVLKRSADDGASWGDELTPVHKLDITAEEIEAQGPRDYAAEGPLDPASRDTLVMSGAVPAFLKPDSQPWMRASTDGGRTWRRHILLPMGDLPALSGCGSTIARSDGMWLTGLAMTTEDGWMNRPLVYASRDGIDWRFLSFIAAPGARDHGFSTRQGSIVFSAKGQFYPRLVELKDGSLLAAVRLQREAKSVLWTDIYRSRDGGLTWDFLSRASDWGAPGDLVAMQDGRVACVYGYRVKPYGIRARVSEDGGATWGDELILRDDGGSWDLGYPRAIEVAPGRILTGYYMNRADDPVQLDGGVRHIAQTVFTPD